MLLLFVCASIDVRRRGLSDDDNDDDDDFRSETELSIYIYIDTITMYDDWYYYVSSSS